MLFRPGNGSGIERPATKALREGPTRKRKCRRAGRVCPALSALDSGSWHLLRYLRFLLFKSGFALDITTPSPIPPDPSGAPANHLAIRSRHSSRCFLQSFKLSKSGRPNELLTTDIQTLISPLPALLLLPEPALTPRPSAAPAISISESNGVPQPNPRPQKLLAHHASPRSGPHQTAQTAPPPVRFAPLLLPRRRRRGQPRQPRKSRWVRFAARPPHPLSLHHTTLSLGSFRETDGACR